MSDVESKDVATEAPQLDLRLKEHTSVMSMDEFVGWYNQYFGGGVQEALEQAALMLCCDVITQDVAKASPPQLYRRTGPKTAEIVMPNEHPVAGLFALEPNRRHTWPEYTEMSVYWHLLTQNAFSAVLRNRQGDPIEIIPVQSSRVIEKVDGRDVFYEITASTEQERALLGTSFLTVHERDMIHVRGRMLDGMDGYSTLVAGAKTIGTGKAMQEFRETLFAEDGAVRGVFQREGAADETMDDKAFQRLRQQLREAMRRFRNMVEPIVIEGGLKFQAIASKPSDMEFAEQFIQQVTETGRLFRVPPHKLFSMDGIKYENLETSEKMYQGDTLEPICRRFEDRMAKILLTPKERLEYFVAFDRDAMTLRDPQRETERVIKALERGAIEVDEARAKLGYNPLPNGQGKTRLIPTNMTVVGEDGKVLIAGSSTAKPDEDGKDEPKPAEEPKKGLRLVQ